MSLSDLYLSIEWTRFFAFLGLEFVIWFVHTVEGAAVLSAPDRSALRHDYRDNLWIHSGGRGLWKL